MTVRHIISSWKPHCQSSVVKCKKIYKKLSKFALSVLVPFASTYLCESGFSTLVLIKTKMRNKLDVADDMRLALSKTEPDIIKLTNELQAQPSH